MTSESRRNKKRREYTKLEVQRQPKKRNATGEDQNVRTSLEHNGIGQANTIENSQSKHANAVNNTNAIMEPSKEQRVSIIKKQFYKWKFGSINIRTGKEKEGGGRNVYYCTGS